MRTRIVIVVVVLLTAGCATMPEGMYAPAKSANRAAVAQSFHRAIQAAGEDPAQYSFWMVSSREITVSRSGGRDAIFYFSDGFAALPPRYMDALMAREVSHEILGHTARRNIVQYSVTGALTALGVVVPGLGVIDFIVNPIVVRAFTRHQEIEADHRAVDMLRAMGYDAPRRALADALRFAYASRREHDGIYATAPSLADRLAAIGPLEPLGEVGQLK